MKTIKNFFYNLVTPRFIFIVAVALSVAAWYWSYTNNYVLTYNDAASHLNIARRIVDNYTPGIAQIGTVWLPFPHVLMLILAWNDFLWETAIAGSVVSMIAYVLSVVFTYKTVELLTGKKIGALIGALIVALNPNHLYLQGTPMTESLLLAMFVLGCFYLAKYVKEHDVKFLIITSIYVMLSTLIRYDGWFLFGVLTILIFALGILKYGRKRAEGETVLFGIIGGLGIALWVVWNLAIFGDPLYFITGPYSAYAQQKVLESVGQLPTAHNLYNATFYYTWAVIGNNGLILTLIAAVCALVSPFIVKNKAHIVVIIAILSPFIFNIIALYIGQSALNVPQAPTNPGTFNTRYGIMMLPAIGFIIGFVASKVRFASLLAIVLLAVQLVLFVKGGTPLSLADGLNGLQNTYYTVEASKWLADNYKGGLILTTLASHDAFVARAHIPMRNYIHEGNSIYYEAALIKPSDTIKYVALLKFPPDAVYRKLKTNQDFIKNYSVIHTYNEFHIYERNW